MRVRRYRKDRGHIQDAAAMTVLGKLGALWLLGQALETESVEVRQLVRQDREIGIQQIQHREISREDFLKKEDRLVVDGGLDFGIVIRREQRLIRFDVAAQLARVEPLIDESLG